MNAARAGRHGWFVTGMFRERWRAKLAALLALLEFAATGCGGTTRTHPPTTPGGASAGCRAGETPAECLRFVEHAVTVRSIVLTAQVAKQVGASCAAAGRETRLKGSGCSTGQTGTLRRRSIQLVRSAIAGISGIRSRRTGFQTTTANSRDTTPRSPPTTGSPTSSQSTGTATMTPTSRCSSRSCFDRREDREHRAGADQMELPDLEPPPPSQPLTPRLIMPGLPLQELSRVGGPHRPLGRMRPRDPHRADAGAAGMDGRAPRGRDIARGRPGGRHPAPARAYQRRDHVRVRAGIDNTEIIHTVHERPAPVISASNVLRIDS